jgi:hypothetical protein
MHKSHLLPLLLLLLVISFKHLLLLLLMSQATARFSPAVPAHAMCVCHLVSIVGSRLVVLTDSAAAAAAAGAVVSSVQDRLEHIQGLHHTPALYSSIVFYRIMLTCHCC